MTKKRYGTVCAAVTHIFTDLGPHGLTLPTRPQLGLTWNLDALLDALATVEDRRWYAACERRDREVKLHFQQSHRLDRDQYPIQTNYLVLRTRTRPCQWVSSDEATSHEWWKHVGKARSQDIRGNMLSSV